MGQGSRPGACPSHPWVGCSFAELASLLRDTGIPDWLTAAGATMANYPDHLSEGISELSRLLVNEEALEDTLQRVADLACRNIGGADVAGVTLLQDGKPTTAAFTDRTSPEI